jgi:hypothetical protein
MATVTQAYRFALDPTPIQRRALASHCGAARVAHNWGLALVKTHLDSIEPTRRCRCHGRCPSCGGSGIGRRTRLPLGGLRTPRRPTPPASMDWPER